MYADSSGMFGAAIVSNVTTESRFVSYWFVLHFNMFPAAAKESNCTQVFVIVQPSV